MKLEVEKKSNFSPFANKAIEQEQGARRPARIFEGIRVIE